MVQPISPEDRLFLSTYIATFISNFSAKADMGGDNNNTGGFVSPAAIDQGGNGGTVFAGNDQNVNAVAGTAVNNSQALVIHQQQGQLSGASYSRLGHSIVTVTVGLERIPFHFHKNILLKAAPGFAVFLGDVNNQVDNVHFDNHNPGTLANFENYVYYGIYPEVQEAMSTIEQATHILQMCQFYAFGEKIHMPNEFKNKLMDNIQGGFIIMNKLPEFGLIQGIYQHTPEGSHLRAFCAHSLVFGHHSGFPPYEALADFMEQNRPVLIDVLEASKIFVPGTDPRVRNCRGEEGCAECAGGKVPSGPGYWPCAFHAHDLQDAGCYLWDL